MRPSYFCILANEWYAVNPFLMIFFFRQDIVTPPVTIFLMINTPYLLHYMHITA